MTAAGEKDCGKMGGGTKEGAGTGFRHHFSVNKELLPIKMILFLFSGGTSAFLPFLTLHMQQLGITVSEIAIIYAFLPIASLMGPPICGIMADRTRRYKGVLLFTMVVTTVLHCMLLYVPARTQPPADHAPTLACGPYGHNLTWAACTPCHRNLSTLHLTLHDCRFMCEKPPPQMHVCLHHPSLPDHCTPLNLTQQINVTGSVTLTSGQSECGEGGQDCGEAQHDEGREEGVCSHVWYELLGEERVFSDLRCPSTCPVQCQVSGAPSCLHLDQDPAAPTNTFALYFALRMVATFFLSSSFTMMDATTLAVVKEYGSDYGKQRMLSTVGLSVAPLIAGVLVDYHSANLGYSDYMPVFYLGTALLFLSMLLILKLRVTVDMASKNLLQDLKTLVTKVEIDLFLIMILVLGSNWGFIESYLFVFLKALNAPNYLLGLTLTVGCLAGTPVMYVADAVVAKLGRHFIFIISFFTYTIRHLGYSYMTNPWMVFPFELLELFTYQIMWVAAVTYCPILAPQGLLATMTGLAGATHYSIGRGVGAFLGGYLISQLGLSTTFRIFSCVSGICGALYTLTYFCFLRGRLADKVSEENGKKTSEDEIEDEGQAMLEGSYICEPTIISSHRRGSLVSTVSTPRHSLVL